MLTVRTEEAGGMPASDTTSPTTVNVPYTDPLLKEQVDKTAKIVKNMAIYGGVGLLIVGGISLYALMSKEDGKK